MTRTITGTYAHLMTKESTMGITRMGAPRNLILDFKTSHQLTHFIETGTYLGDTAFWASQHFAHVTTIELAQSIYEKTSSRYAGVPNIDFRFGDSRKVLTELAPSLTSPTLFWLDGHWSGGETYGADDQCPLIEEIHAINTSPSPHFILIDDARLFTSTPPIPHNIDVWASITEIIDTLRAKHDYFIVIIEDNIIAVPMSARQQLQAYCQQVNTTNEERRRLEDGRTRTQKGLMHLRMGIGLLRRGIRNNLTGKL